MNCPNNPNGEHHELNCTVPAFEEHPLLTGRMMTEKWMNLSMSDKAKSQFCKWCGVAIW